MVKGVTMGADIHMYIETNDGKHWYPFGGRINPGRNYQMFGALAGVRCKQPKGMVPPRGMPPDPAWCSQEDNLLYVNEDGRSDPRRVGYCTKEYAELWVRNGISEWVKDKQAVTHPDWHTHSWLTTKEYAAAVEYVESVYGKLALDTGYRAVLAAMKAFEDDGISARIVFWFDN